MASKRVTRRDFIKTTAAGAVATGLGPIIFIPKQAYGASARKTLKILQWVHFVPAFDKWFNEKYVKEWGEKNNTEVTVDNIGIAGLSARAAAECAISTADSVQFHPAANNARRFALVTLSEQACGRELTAHGGAAARVGVASHRLSSPDNSLTCRALDRDKIGMSARSVSSKSRVHDESVGPRPR